MKTTPRGLAAISAVIALGLLFGCNPYKQLGSRPPLSSKDSAALLSRCIKITPLDTATNIPAYIPPALPPDSTGHYQQLIDSLLGLKPAVLERIREKYKDTCFAAAQDNYNDGFRDGQTYGEQLGRKTSYVDSRKTMALTDSISRVNYSAEINRLKQAYNIRLKEADVRVSVAENKADKYQRRSDARGGWLIFLTALSALLLIICILLWKFRRQAKAANSVINSADDTVDGVKKLFTK